MCCKVKLCPVWLLVELLLWFNFLRLMHQSWKQREINASVMKNVGEVTSMCSQVQLRFKSITVVWVINASVFNQFLGRVFASLTRNILFWYKIKLSGSHSDGKKEVTSYYVSTSKVAGNNKSKFWKISEFTNPAWWRENDCHFTLRVYE